MVTKTVKLWRFTFSVDLPNWLADLSWILHPIRTYREYIRIKEEHALFLRQQELEAKWDKLFTEAFATKKPEFEFDEKKPGRVVGLKETLSESHLPSVGVWSAYEDEGVLSRAIKSAGMTVNLEPADEYVVEERRQKMDKIRYDMLVNRKKK